MRRIRLALTVVLESVVAIVVAILLLVVLWGVVSRYLIDLPSRWTEELATQLLTWVAMLGGAVGFSRRQHLGVDILFAKADLDVQRLMTLVVQTLVMIFAIIVMVWGGSLLVINTWNTGQVTAALGIRMGLVYLSLPIGGLFIVFFCAEQLWEILRGVAPIDDQHETSTASSE